MNIKQSRRIMHTVPDDFLISRQINMTYGELSRLMAVNEPNPRLVEFIEHRLRSRYIIPLLSVPDDLQSNFLMMASACLLIESLESFYQGHGDTEGVSQDTFRAFFDREKVLFPGFVENVKSFYRNIRCGVLHQAETRCGYRLVKEGAIFDEKARTINARAVIEALNICIENYLDELRQNGKGHIRWDNALAKLQCIRDNCKRC